MLGKAISAFGAIGAASVVASILLPNVLFTVPPGSRGLIFHRVDGVQNTVYKEGIHFKIPWFENPIIMDVRTVPSTISTVTGTKDLQQVSLSLRVLSHPRVESLPEIYRTLNTDYNERVLPSLFNEVLKAVVAQYDVDQLITQRDTVSREIKESLLHRCAKFNILLDDVSITHLAFSPDFSRAIEEKQVAEQTAERAKFIVMRAEQEKQALIIRSEGDAEAAQLVSNALQKAGNGLIELRRIETALLVAKELSEKPNVTYLPQNANMMMMMPSNKEQH